MSRSAESVPFNIVEGCGSHSQKDFARFLDISIKSTSELQYQLLLAKDYGVLAPDMWRAFNERTIDTRRMLCGLRAKVIEPDSINHGKTEDGINGKRTTRIQDGSVLSDIVVRRSDTLEQR